MGHVTTGVIVARAAAIAGLTAAGAAGLRVLAQVFAPLSVMHLTLPVAVVTSVLFVAVAVVQMLRWRTLAHTLGEQVSYQQRVLRLCVTWGALTLLAAVAVVARTYLLAAAFDIDVPADGTALLTVVTVGPLLPLGMGATAAVEAAYERGCQSIA